MIEFLLEIPLNERITRLAELFVKKPIIELHFENTFYEFITWGDPIYSKDFQKRFEKDSTPEFIVNNLYGHYYYLYLNKRAGDILFGNSFFSILPLYYHKGKGKITLSENAVTLGRYTGSDEICNRFILEAIMFNYPLFNNSIFQDINLLPSNSFLSIRAGEVSVNKHTFIENLFEKNPVPWRKSVKTTADKFLESVEKYLPDKHYATSLTGGFDGRTLVSAGLFFNKNFSTYSFGSETSKDIIIAEALSSKASLSYIKIGLGEDYARQKSLEFGKEFILNSSGAATFARAHYLYAAKQLKGETDTIVTGNFGSEIFRAAHISGVVISENLFNFFIADSPSETFKAIELSPEFNCMNKSTIKEEWESLKEDILKLSCLNKDYSGLTRNQRFYVFVFEELFRKYFGAEMVNQFGYLKNRTPYLDIDFLKAVFKTELSGIHSGFFENNPMKRYKGQVLYAYIIRKAYPEFSKMMTDKGYKPDDLINFLGKINISKGYLKKKITRKSPRCFDSYGVAKSWEANRDYWNRIPVSSEYFNVTELKSINKEILYKIISLSYLMQVIGNL